jgi:hypothetical protein
MKFRVLAASAIAGCVIPTAFAQISAVHTQAQTKIQSHKEVVVAPPTRPTNIPLAPPTNDDCSTPTAISGNGTFPFNNSAATTGTQGQSNANCLFFGTMGITNDIWFSWTAGGSGTATLALCGGTTMDSKVAIYNGSGCPAAAAIACNDDSCSVQSQVSWPATSGTTYTVQLGNFPGATGSSGTFMINVVPAATNDDCSMPVVLSGPGPYAFNNSSATTGPQGQGNANCLFFGTMGISNDVWFTYTASATGNATLALCGGTSMDSKVAVYAGAGCPSSMALACNDDSCSLQSQVTWSATNGSTYTIQLGNFPGATGSTGTFTINVAPPPGLCTNHDDGSSENAIGLTAGGDVMWLQRFGAIGQTTTVTTISTAWGSPINPPTGNPPNGTPCDICIYNDPNNDGNPTDGVLMQHITGMVTGTGTDAFQTFALLPPVSITGYVWVGAAVAGAAGIFPAPLDQPGNPTFSGQAWIVGETGGSPLNFTNLGANNVAPLDIGSAGFPGQWLLRVTCNNSAGVPFCSAHTVGMIRCPCLPGGNGSGCGSGSNSGLGANLSSQGTPSLASDNVILTTTPLPLNVLCTLLQGISNNNPPLVFGQGVICTGGNLLRLYIENAHGPQLILPNGADSSVSAASAAHGDVLTPGAVRYYQTWFRDPVVPAPCPAASTFNISDGLIITWGS